MHSTVFELSDYPIPAAQQATPGYLPDWFFCSVCDYATRMTDTEREDSIAALVNSFGATVMAAFAAAVKIDTFAYLPVQDFGNAFSTFVAQNYGAGQRQRIRRGFRNATLVSAGFSALISLLVCVFAQPLMRIFVQAGEVEVLAAGVRYLRIEGACYVGIGCLFLSNCAYELNFGACKLNCSRNYEYLFAICIKDKRLCRHIIQQCIIDAVIKVFFFNSESTGAVSLRIKIDNQRLTTLLTQCCC